MLTLYIFNCFEVRPSPIRFYLLPERRIEVVGSPGSLPRPKVG